MQGKLETRFSYISCLLPMSLSNLRVVPLHRPSLGFILCSSINGIPSFNNRLCLGNLFGTNVFKYSTLKRKISLALARRSTLNFIKFPSSQSCIYFLIYWSQYNSAFKPVFNVNVFIQFRKNLMTKVLQGSVKLCNNLNMHRCQNKNKTITIFTIPDVKCPSVEIFQYWTTTCHHPHVLC